MRWLGLAAAGATLALLAAWILFVDSGNRDGEATAGRGNQPMAAPRRSAESGERVHDRLNQLRHNYTRRHLEEGAPTPMDREVPMAAAGRGRPEEPPEAGEEDEAGTVERLKQTALGDPDPDNRITAVVLLGGEDGPETLRVIVEALNDPDPDVRLIAVGTLGDRAEELTADMLLPAVRDRDPEVRFEAIGVLGDIETPEALALVRAAKDDPDEDVRSLAEGILDFAAAEGQVEPEGGGAGLP